LTVNPPTTFPYAYYGPSDPNNTPIIGGEDQTGQQVMTSALTELNQLKLDLLALQSSATVKPYPSYSDLNIYLESGGIYDFTNGLGLDRGANQTLHITGPPAQTIIMSLGIYLDYSCNFNQGLQNPSDIIWFNYSTSGMEINNVQNFAGVCISNKLLSVGNYNRPSLLNCSLWSLDSINIHGDVTMNPITLCFLRGTPIMTLCGYTPIENLQKGDLVATFGKIQDNHSVSFYEKPLFTPIVWIQHFKPNVNEVDTYPIRFQKGCLGKNIPEQDIWVSPEHRMIIDGRMIPAKNLVNGSTIIQDKEIPIEDIEYYHFETDQHSVVDVLGLKTETFINFGYGFRDQPSKTQIGESPMSSIVKVL